MYREQTILLNNYDNINTLNFVLLTVFPIVLFFILFFKCKILKKNEFNEDAFGINDAKALQVFAAFGILIHHLSGASTNYGDVFKGSITVMSFVGILFTSIFFFFSGFGLIRSYESKENYLDGFVRSKFMTVFVPFMITNLLYVLIGLSQGRITDALSFFTSVFGITLINTNAWFIVEILILYIAFYLIFKNIKTEKYKIPALSLVAFLMTLTGFLLKHDYTRINGHWFRGEWWFNTTMIFVLGLIFGKNRDVIFEFLKKNYSKLLPANFALLILSAIFESYARNNMSYYVETYTYYGYPEKLVTYISQTILCVLFITFTMLILMKVKFGNRILKFLSVYTFEIYLIQDICMLNYGYDEQAPDWLLFTVIIIATVGCAILLKVILKFVNDRINSFIDRKYEDEHLTIEKRARYKNDVTIVKGFILFYALMAAGLVISAFTQIKIMYHENSSVLEQVEAIKGSEQFDEVSFGYFDTDSFTDGNETLVWYVIAKEDNKALLLMKDSLYPYAYNKTFEETTYKDSDIRDIVINEVCYEVINNTARKYLVDDSVTGDKVFLLSVDEVRKYDIPADVLMSKPTKDAKEFTGILIDKHNKNAYWWLRSDGLTINASVVDSNGNVNSSAEEVSRTRFAIRPAIWVNLN